MLFRSIAIPVVDKHEKAMAMDALIEHMVPGRTSDTRSPTSTELTATLVVRLSIVEGSAKIRTGPPIEEESDLELPFWAGEIPLSIAVGAPIPDPQLSPAIATPRYVSSYAR